MNYQELLAETYRENVVEHFSDNEEEEPDVDAHAEHDYDNSEVADPNAFKKFGGNRGHPETLPKHVAFDDKSKNSMRYEKDIQINSFNIDSRFRDYSAISQRASTTLASIFGSGSVKPGLDGFSTSISSNFVFTLPRTIKNVYSVALTSIEFPNSFYEFDAELYNNTTMTIIDVPNQTSYSVTISDGNYDTFVNFALAVQFAIRNSTNSNGVVNTCFSSFNITYSTLTGKLIFSNPTQFTFIFPPSIHPTANGLGYFLGFAQVDYTNSPSQAGNYSITRSGKTKLFTTTNSLITNYGLPSNTTVEIDDHRMIAENTPVILSNNYIYLALNDWDVITHRDFNNAHFNAFAKIMVPSVKYTVVYDSDTTNTTVKEFFFQQPKDINKIAITLYDAYGNILNLQGSDFSFTLELKQILNMNLYEKLREL